MRENFYFSMQSTSQHSSQRPKAPLQLQNQFTFPPQSYYFPNQPNFIKKHKGFKTVIQINRRQLPQHYNKRLSLLNRSRFAIQLKQIKKEERSPQIRNNYVKLLLYYQMVPFSLCFAKEGPLNFTISAGKLERMLREVFNDLVGNNIFYEVAIQNCGFTQNGEFRVFVPPLSVLREKKLSAGEKQAVFMAIQKLMEYWQSELPKTMEYLPVETTRKSNRFSSPQQHKHPEKQQIKNSDQEQINVKKTIKLTKNHLKQLVPEQQPQCSKLNRLYELKKHKSMQILLEKQKPIDIKKRSSANFMDKINSLNEKLLNIKETYKRKKEVNEQIENIRNRGRGGEVREEVKEEIIYERHKDRGTKQHFYVQSPKEDDCQSDDTYLQEMGQEYDMPSFKPNHGMRKTELPEHLKQSSKRQSSTNWHHQSAGNMMFKKFIQKSRDAYPEYFDVRDNKSVSKTSVKHLEHNEKPSSSVAKNVTNATRLKKMVSMETFQNREEIKSIHLSQYSKQMSNVRHRRQKEARNLQIRQKVQDILLKSKKAIQFLKSPNKKIN